MSEPFSHTQDQILKERMQHEAREATPPFCETLHRQILDAISRHQEADCPPAPRRRDATSRFNRFVVAVSAAACLLALIAFGWQLRQSDRDAVAVASNTNPAGSTPSKPASDRNEVGIESLILSAAIAPHSAALEHDTRLAAATLLERLPIGAELVAGP
jgi:hypothetical protein